MRSVLLSNEGKKATKMLLFDLCWLRLLSLPTTNNQHTKMPSQKADFQGQPNAIDNRRTEYDLGFVYHFFYFTEWSTMNWVKKGNSLHRKERTRTKSSTCPVQKSEKANSLSVRSASLRRAGWSPSTIGAHAWPWTSPYTTRVYRCNYLWYTI